MRNKMLLVSLLAALALSMFMKTVPLYAADPICKTGNRQVAPITGYLHTCGTEVYDKNNNEVVLNGVNLGGLEWGAGCENGKDCPFCGKGIAKCLYCVRSNGNGCNQCVKGDTFCPYSNAVYGGYNVPTLAEIEGIEQAGFNVIRLPISWANIEPLENVHDDTYIGELKNVLDLLKSHKIAVILSMHQWAWSPYFKVKNPDGNLVNGLGMPQWFYSGEYGTYTPDSDGQHIAECDFFQNDKAQIQEKYIINMAYILNELKGNSNVIGIDMFNEPAATNCKVNLEKFYKNLAKAIDGVNPNLLLFFQDSGNITVDNPQNIDAKNLIYSFHFAENSCEEWPGSQPGNDEAALKNKYDKQQTVQGWKRPFWIGEWALFGNACIPGTCGTCNCHKETCTYPCNSNTCCGWVKSTIQMLDAFNKYGFDRTYWSYQGSIRPLADNEALIYLIQRSVGINK